MIVEVLVAIDPRPIWWRSVDGPPPTPWVDVFASFTGTDTADEWGLAAAIFIAQTRRRTGMGPTFSEMFLELLPDTDGIPSSIVDEFDYRERRQLIGDFRIHAAIEWRRRGWISWERGVERSLRVGKVFRAHSRRFQAERAARIRAWEEMTAEQLALEAPDPQPGDRTLYGAEAAEFGARTIEEALEDDDGSRGG
ncbi:hypothetical protein [Microbacterium capsulatum]|uniref:Uncharacterized protein n=1 Tax=Microbacterium capsulatum TaxID=3041921 RepID=A0ABU0XKE7_9MICO|nr:hypothetical protein [Microbacterium sp. ASV81]MDQ4215058.1 hypothetical protein [Microbacterium sp. ASV81]